MSLFSQIPDESTLKKAARALRSPSACAPARWTST